MGRFISELAVNIVKESESLHDGDLHAIGLQPKQCPAGIWTVGYGHALRNPNTGAFLRGMADRSMAYSMYSALSVVEAEQMLAQDLAEFAENIERVITVPVTDNQFGALLSLTFNIGIGAFSRSTLLKYLNAGDFRKAADQILVWNKMGKKVLKGLVKRRAKEYGLFMKG